MFKGQLIVMMFISLRRIKMKFQLKSKCLIYLKTQ